MQLQSAASSANLLSWTLQGHSCNGLERTSTGAFLYEYGAGCSCWEDGEQGAFRSYVAATASHSRKRTCGSRCGERDRTVGPSCSVNLPPFDLVHTLLSLRARVVMIRWTEDRSLDFIPAPNIVWCAAAAYHEAFMLRAGLLQRPSESMGEFPSRSTSF